MEAYMKLWNENRQYADFIKYVDKNEDRSEYWSHGGYLHHTTFSKFACNHTEQECLDNIFNKKAKPFMACNCQMTSTFRKLKMDTWAYKTLEFFSSHPESTYDQYMEHMVNIGYAKEWWSKGCKYDFLKSLIEWGLLYKP